MGADEVHLAGVDAGVGDGRARRADGRVEDGLILGKDAHGPHNIPRTVRFYKDPLFPAQEPDGFTDGCCYHRETATHCFHGSIG